MSTHLLLNEKPLMVLPSLAKLIGINGSIAVQQIHWFVEIKEEHSDDRTLYQGFLWCKYSLKQWQDKLQWMTVDGISRMFARLETQNIIVSCQPDSNRRDQTKWYRVNYEGLSKFERPLKSTIKGDVEQLRDRPQVEMRDRPQVEMRDRPQVEMRDRPQVEMRDRPQVEMINIKEINKKTNKEINKETHPRDLFASEAVLISNSDLPAKQVLIDCMADQKENPIPPTPLSLLPPESFATGAKAKKPSFEAKRGKYQPFLDVWVQDKVEDWVNHESLSKTAISKLETFTATHGDRAMEIFQKSLWYAQSDPFHKKVLKRWSLEQYLSNDKPYQNFEKYEQSPKKESAQGDVLMSSTEVKKAQTYIRLQQAMGLAS
jgi:hypothetical protein